MTSLYNTFLFLARYLWIQRWIQRGQTGALRRYDESFSHL